MKEWLMICTMRGLLDKGWIDIDGWMDGWDDWSNALIFRTKIILNIRQQY
jgi:hypothetical protein